MRCCHRIRIDRYFLTQDRLDLHVLKEKRNGAGHCEHSGITVCRDGTGDSLQIIVGAGKEVQVIKFRKDILCILKILVDLDCLILRLVIVGIVIVVIAGIVFVFLLRRLAVVVDVDQGTFIPSLPLPSPHRWIRHCRKW